MRRFLAGLLVGVVITAGAVVMAEERPIRLFVDGKEVVGTVAPQMINGVTIVEARPLAEALGAKVEWNEAEYAVVVTGAPKIVPPPPAPAPIPKWKVQREDGVYIASYVVMDTAARLHPGVTLSASKRGFTFGNTMVPIVLYEDGGGMYWKLQPFLDAGVLALTDLPTE